MAIKCTNTLQPHFRTEQSEVVFFRSFHYPHFFINTVPTIQNKILYLLSEFSILLDNFILYYNYTVLL